MAPPDTNIFRWRIAWSGFPGSPGVSTFYTSSDPAIALNTYLHSFFGSLVSYIPANTTISYPTVVDVLDPFTGNLLSSLGVTPAAPTVCTGSGSYAAPAGFAVRWNTTGTVTAVPPKHGARRVTGHTFIVPAIGAAMTTSGSVLAAVVTAANTAAGTLLTSVAGNLYIWTRPVYAATGAIARNGQVSSVVSGSCLPKAVTLRSRRD